MATHINYNGGKQVGYTTATFEHLMEHEVNGVDYKYVYGNDRLSVNITGVENGAGHILENGEIRFYYHMDLRGTTDYLTSPVSQKVESWTHYNEWGEITHNAVVKCGQREFDMVKRYATHDYDQVLGMFYAKARFYDAGDRRFVAVDPIKGNVAEPMTMVQYLYVVNNPLILIDLLGLNPTNELLHMDWSQIRIEDVKVGNRIFYYANIVDVLNQLSSADTYGKNSSSSYYDVKTNTATFTISQGGKSLVLQAGNGSGTANSTGIINNSAFNPVMFDNSNYMNIETIFEYFSRVWCEDYYAEGLSTAEARYIIALMEIASNNAELMELRDVEVEALIEARNFLITGTATRSTYMVAVDVEIKSSTFRKGNEIAAERFVRVTDNLITAVALVTGHPYVAAFSNLVTAGATNDPIGAALVGAGLLPGIPGKMFTGVGAVLSGTGTADSLHKDIVNPENIDINIYLKSDRYNRLVFEITPDGVVADVFYVISDDYKLGYEYEPHKGQIPPDLKFKYYNSGGGFTHESIFYD